VTACSPPGISDLFASAAHAYTTRSGLSACLRDMDYFSVRLRQLTRLVAGEPSRTHPARRICAAGATPHDDTAVYRAWVCPTVPTGAPAAIIPGSPNVGQRGPPRGAAAMPPRSLAAHYPSTTMARGLAGRARSVLAR